jgi:hypothetical protein
MLSQEKLLKAIEADMGACRAATHAPDDRVGRDRQLLELATLTRHQQMAFDAGSDQAELERVVQSLETNMVVRYQQWRELSTV